MSSRLSKDLDYQVLGGSDADEAACEVDATTPDRVDLFSPMWSCRAQAAAISPRKPSGSSRTQGPFMTGYSRNAIVHQGRLDPGVDLIQKPLTEDALAAMVRKLLDG